jgi:hypothetical protein
MTPTNTSKNITTIYGLSALILILCAIIIFLMREELVDNSKLNEFRAAKIAAEHTTQRMREQNKFLNQEFNKLSDSASVLLSKNVELDRELATSRAQTKEKVKSARAATHQEIEKILRDRYQTTSVVAGPSGVTMTDSIPNKVVADLYKGDGAISEASILSEKASNAQAAVEVKDAQIGNLTQQNGNLEAAVAANEIALGVADKTVTQQSADIERLTKNNKTLKKGVAAGVILGFVGGVLIAN